MKKFLSVLGFLAFLLPQVASADLTTTPTVTQPGDQTVLHTYIAASATSITLEPLYKYVNGVKTKGCIDTPSGFATITDLSRTEWISFGSKACSTTTYITTLSSVRRGLSPTSASFAAGTGMNWDAGSTFRIIDYTIIYNNALYKDVQNSLSGSGQITGTNTNQAIFRPNCVTTAQRNAFTNVANGDIICNSTVGTNQFYYGNWYSFGSGGTTSNATETSKGGVQLGTISDQISKTRLGTAGPTVPQTANLTQSGSIHTSNNTYQAGRIPILNSSGALAASLGGTGISSAATGSILVTSGSGGMQIIPATTNSGNVLISNGRRWRAANAPVRILDVKLVAGSNLGASSTSETNVYQYGIATGSLAVNDIIHVKVAMVLANEYDVFRFRVGSFSGAIIGKLGGLDLTNATPPTGNEVMLEADITIRSIGAGGTASADYKVVSDQATAKVMASSSAANISIDTTKAVFVTATHTFTSSNGSNTVHYEQAMTMKYSTP